MTKELSSGEVAPTGAWKLSADRPIAGRKEDRFQRASFADALVDQVLALPPNDSFVIGLVGPWGSGKTSVLSMFRETVGLRTDIALLTFNPWLFSGTEQLAGHFFQELAAQLHESRDKKLQEAGDLFVAYSEALSPLSAVPIVGKWLERVAGGGKFLGGLLRKKGGALPASVTAQRTAIEKLLKAQGKRLLVIVDDIDRLPKSDIRELFKLVRLTADFPNTTYILAFDRPRVEDALSETEGEGRDYLEKILQATYDVPLVRGDDLTTFLLAELDRVIEGRVHGPFDTRAWASVFNYVVRPLFRTPRDVRRYTNGIPVALAVVGDEIALADLLAVEAVRCLLPDVWSRLYACADVLTNAGEAGSFQSSRRQEDEKARFEALLELAGDHRAAIQELCARVFPASCRLTTNNHYGSEWANRWRRGRRLASPELLRFYFEKNLPKDTLRASEVHKLFELLDNEEALRRALASLESSMVEHLCGRLEVYEEEFPPSAVEPALVTFFNQLPRLREDPSGPLDIGSEFAVTRLGLRLLRRIEGESDRGELVRRVLPRIARLSGRQELVDLVGWRKDAGHELVSRDVAAEIEVALRVAIRTASTEDLAEERDLLSLLRSIDDGDDAVPSLAKAHARDDRFLLRLLRSALGRQQAALPWDYLIELLGKEVLCARIRDLEVRQATFDLDARGKQSIETAMRYCGGWRPGRLSDQRADEAEAGPSAAERAEERKYGAQILGELLSSVVPARRKVARDRIAHMAANNMTVDAVALDGLAAIAIDEQVAAPERVAVIDLLCGLRAEARVVSQLSRQWFTSKSVTADLSQRIAALFHNRPQDLHRLAASLETALAGHAAHDRIADGILAVGYLFEHHAAQLPDDHVARAMAAVEAFAGNDDLRPKVDVVRKAHAGESR